LTWQDAASLKVPATQRHHCKRVASARHFTSLVSLWTAYTCIA